MRVAGMYTNCVAGKSVLLAVSTAALLTVCFLVTSCGDKQPSKDTTEAIRPVKTMVLGDASAGELRSFPGRVKASQEVDLAFEVAGRIVEFPVNRGQAVEKGQLLAKLDKTDFENAAARQKAKRDNAKVNANRAERLLASGSVSQAEYDSRKAAFDMAEAEWKIADKSLQDASLKAPFEGLVADKFVENYQNVQAKENILSLQDVSEIEIVVNVPEDLVVSAKAGKVERLTARFEAVPGKTFDVTIKEFGTEANKQSQTFPVTVTMPAPKDLNILPGMTATITGESPTRGQGSAGVFKIPETSVFADEKGRPHAWVVDRETMTAKRREVKTGQLTGGNIIILEGLKAGDMIISAGVDYIRDNMKVRPLEKKRGDRK
jgi:RND family efflux transporter MFP subunit